MPIYFEKIYEGKKLRLLFRQQFDSEQYDLRQLIEDKGDIVGWFEAVEWELCNGWQSVSPEDCGALTSDPYMVSDCVERDGGGEIKAIDRVYFYPHHQIKSPVLELLDGNDVIFESIV